MASSPPHSSQQPPTQMMMMQMRGRSVEPEIYSSRPQYVTRRQMRAKSAGPTSHQDKRASRLLNPDSDRALINQHVNPYQEFPSLKRGFTLEGMPIIEKDEAEGDAFAYYFWAIAIFFFTLALLNFLVLVVIMHVLEIGPQGMAAIEFLPESGSVKFLKDLVAPVITVGTGVISGFAGEPMSIVAENGDIVFQVKQGSLGGQPQLRISPHEVTLANVDNFRIGDPSTGKVFFDAFAPEFEIQDPVESLSASEVETNRLVSPLHKDLFIKSDSGLDLMGAEGIQVEAKTVRLEAGQDITLTSISGAINIEGQVGLDPLALPIGGGGYPGETSQYKLCICGHSGKVFAVPVSSKSKDSKSASGLACLQVLKGEKHPCDD